MGVKSEWANELSDAWGATSLHAAVFHRPRGVQWVHCNACRSRSSPSGMRSMVLPARGPVEMEVVCRTTQALLRADAAPSFGVQRTCPVASEMLGPNVHAELKTNTAICEPIAYE